MYCNGITSWIASQVEWTAYIHVICGAAKAPEPRPWFLAAQCLDEHVPSGAFPPKQITVRGSQCFLKECPPWCGWACPLCLRSCLSVSGLVLSPFVPPFVWGDVSALSPVLSPCFRTCLVSFRASLCVGRRVRLSPVLSPCFRTCLVSFRASLCVGRRVRLVSGLVGLALSPSVPPFVWDDVSALSPVLSPCFRTCLVSYLFIWCSCNLQQLLVLNATVVVFFFLGFALQPCLSLLHIALSINLQTWNLLVVTNYVWVVGSAQRRSGWLPRMIDLTTWCNYHWSNHHLFSNVSVSGWSSHLFSNNNKINHIFCQ